MEELELPWKGRKMEKLLLRPTEVAEVLGLGRSMVYALLAEGILPGIRVGKSIRIPAEALRRWVDNRVKDCEKKTNG